MATKTHILTGPGMGPSLRHLRTWLAEHVPAGVDESQINLGVSQNGKDWKLTLRIEDLT